MTNEFRIQATDRDGKPIGPECKRSTEGMARLAAAEAIANDRDVFGVQITVVENAK